MSRKDFENWLIGKPDWKTISWEYNTGKKYQSKQDLIAVFWNSYIYYQLKFEVYFKEFNTIPTSVFQDLIFEFRQTFPKKGRVKGINYFDDLIEQLIEKHSLAPQQTDNSKPMSITKDLQVFSFFQIEIETTIGDSVKDMFTKDELKKIDLNKKIKVRNNDSIITPENWNEYKDIFFKQRMSYYKASYTENEKIKLELEELNKLTISSPDYKILKKRYEDYLYGMPSSVLPQQTEAQRPDEVNDKHPKHDPNLWNLECYKLFKYLFDNYYIKTKRQLTNIWFYLNEYDQIKYNLKATKEEYISFIKRNYEITITNFDKAQHKFQKEYGTINEHRTNYEDNF